MKRYFFLLLAAVFLLTGCTAPPAEATPDTTASSLSILPQEQVTTVGISLPDEQVARWASEGAALKELLQEEAQVILQYAESDPQIQAEQIGQLIDQKVHCLVVAAVDSLMLTDVLNRAQAAGILVIAYDRMLVNTNGVSCYVAFDSYQLGTAVGEYIANTKQLQTAAEEQRSYTVEFFMGAPEDNNSLLFYQGVWDLLQTYFNTGVLTCPSGRISFEDTCIQGNSPEQATQMCEATLAEFYPQAMPDILCAASDALAGGCAVALEKAGCPQETWPLITGAGAEPEAISRLASGTQALTAQADSQWLPNACANLVKSALAGESFAQKEAVYNGIDAIPASLGELTLIDGKNDQEVPDSTE